MPDSGKFKDLYLNSAHTYPCQHLHSPFFTKCAKEPSNRVHLNDRRRVYFVSAPHLVASAIQGSHLSMRPKSFPEGRFSPGREA